MFRNLIGVSFKNYGEFDSRSRSNNLNDQKVVEKRNNDISIPLPTTPKLTMGTAKEIRTMRKEKLRRIDMGQCPQNLGQITIFISVEGSSYKT